jgi:CheY-like chemotaxis protein
MADRDRFQQIVWNLLTNALKFTPDGGRVEVAVEHAESAVRLAVHDTGRGISPEFLPHVFDRFTQQEGGSTRSHSGMGLGLAVVRHLVDLHGGQITAHSDGLDRGATFVVEFPVPVAIPEPAGARCSDGQTLAGARVLAVDNDADARDMLVEILTTAGASVTAAGSAPEAIALLRDARFDVLISDIGMPDHDGYELIRDVRAARTQPSSGIPAIAITAYTGDGDRTRALDAGYQMHVTKPIAASDLIDAVAGLAATRTQGPALETSADSP